MSGDEVIPKVIPRRNLRVRHYRLSCAAFVATYLDDGKADDNAADNLVDDSDDGTDRAEAMDKQNKEGYLLGNDYYGGEKHDRCHAKGVRAVRGATEVRCEQPCLSYTLIDQPNPPALLPESLSSPRAGSMSPLVNAILEDGTIQCNTIAVRRQLGLFDASLREVSDDAREHENRKLGKGENAAESAPATLAIARSADTSRLTSSRLPSNRASLYPVCEALGSAISVETFDDALKMQQHRFRTFQDPSMSAAPRSATGGAWSCTPVRVLAIAKGVRLDFGFEGAKQIEDLNSSGLVPKGAWASALLKLAPSVRTGPA